MKKISKILIPTVLVVLIVFGLVLPLRAKSGGLDVCAGQENGCIPAGICLTPNDAAKEPHLEQKFHIVLGQLGAYTTFANRITTSENNCPEAVRPATAKLYL